MRKLLLSIALTLMLPHQAWGTDTGGSGNSWLQRCEDVRDNLESGVCIGFLMAIDDGYRLGAIDSWIAISKSPQSKQLSSYKGAIVAYCTPAGVTLGQRKDIFIRYLKSHPETRQDDGAVLYVRAMAEAFPCKSTK